MRRNGALTAVCVISAGVLSACSVQRIRLEKLEELPYTIVEEYEIPEEMQSMILEKKKEAFVCTWADEGELYIARGYGIQETEGCRIQVDSFCESSNTLILKTTLLGPEPGEETEDSTACPYLVLRTEYNSKYVIAE